MNRQLWVRFAFILDDPEDKHNSKTFRRTYGIDDPQAEYMVLGTAGAEFLIQVGDQILNTFPRHVRITRNEPMEVLVEEFV